jgi:Ammonium Transporter Family
MTLASMRVGAAGVVLVVFAIITFEKLKIDDPVGGLSVHGVHGIWGLLAVPSPMWRPIRCSVTEPCIHMHLDLCDWFLRPVGAEAGDGISHQSRRGVRGCQLGRAWYRSLSRIREVGLGPSLNKSPDNGALPLQVLASCAPSMAALMRLCSLRVSL